jgi:hypothetical protein
MRHALFTARHASPWLAAALLTAGCAFESTATANRVPVPVLVGPVEQIGGGPSEHGADEDARSFDVKVDRRFTASSSSQTSGNVTVTTTSTSHVQQGAGLVDANVRLAANGAKNRLVHVDRLRVNSYSGFFYSAAWLTSRVRLKGHVGRKFAAPAAAPAANPTPDPFGQGL